MSTAKNAPGASAPLIEAQGLIKHFPIARGILFSRQVGAVRAVDGVDFAIPRGKTLGLVGESGCGKSTTGRMLIRLIEPTRGTIRFEGEAIEGLGPERMRAVRREMQIIFQDPFGSLNPRMTVQDIIAEPLVVHRWRTRASSLPLGTTLCTRNGVDTIDPTVCRGFSDV